jgi:outer membrane receptor protein involved in Fe transport
VNVFRAAANTPRGSLEFSANESGFNFASFMLGYPSATATGEGFPLALPRANRAGAYVLDEWKVTPRLTVNAGLRWDFFGVPVDSGGFWRTLDFARTFQAPDGSRVPTIFPGKVGPDGSVQLWNQENRFFMPCVGIAFRPANKWVIRAASAGSPMWNTW